MGVLGDSRFGRLLVGQTLSGVGDSALYLTLGIWAEDLTGSNAAAGLVFVFLGLPALFSPLLGSSAGDDRQRDRGAAISPPLSANVAYRLAAALSTSDTELVGA